MGNDGATIEPVRRAGVRIFIAMLSMPLPAEFAAGIADGPEEFWTKVMPFFEANCFKCHGLDKGKVALADFGQAEIH